MNKPTLSGATRKGCFPFWRLVCVISKPKAMKFLKNQNSHFPSKEDVMQKLQIVFSEESEELFNIYQSDEYDYSVPDLEVSVDVELLYHAIKILAENPNKLHHLAIHCDVCSEGFEGKLRYERLVLTPYTSSMTFFLEFFNDWTGTLYEMDLTGQFKEFIGYTFPVTEPLSKLKNCSIKMID